MTLEKLYNSLLSGKVSVEEASEMMKSYEIRTLINSYIYKDKINPLVPFFDTDIQNIQNLVNIAQFIYNNSGKNTGMTDSEYDILYDLMLTNGGSDLASAPILPTTKEVEHHKYPALRGSLKKVYYLTRQEESQNTSRVYLDDWIKQMEDRYQEITGTSIHLKNLEIYVFPKFDGVSAIFEMNERNEIEKVLTRGYVEKNEAQNITQHFKHFDMKKQKEFGVPYGIKTEIMMEEKDLQYYNETYGTEYKNTRSIVSAILNSDTYDEDKARLLRVVPLRVGTLDGKQELAKECFTEYPYIRCTFKDVDRIKEFADSHKYIHEQLRCDGAVLYIIDDKVREILGRENAINYFEVAYKFTEESKYTTLEDLTYTVGLFGRITPLAHIKPVKMKGNTIKKISLGSIGRVKELRLRKGDKVKVLYDIVPYMTMDNVCFQENIENHGEEFEIIERCPLCGELLKYSSSGDIAYCENLDCEARIKGKILNFIAKLDIPNISYGTLDALYEHGYVTCIEDLFTLKKKKKEIADLPGFGDRTVEILLSSIEKRMTMYDYELISALGIHSIGKRTSKAIMKQIDIEELMDMEPSQIYKAVTKVPGIGESTANAFVKGIESNRKLLRHLYDKLQVVTTTGMTEKDAKFYVCFTSMREKEKEPFFKMIERYGGMVTDSLTTATKILVVPDLDTKSSKVTKAKKYHIPVIPKGQFTEDVLRSIIL